MYLRRYSSSILPLGPEILVNREFTIGDQSQPALAVSPNGQMLVAWASTDHQSGWGVYGQLVSTDGALLGSEILVNQSLLGTQWQPSATAIGDGSYVVAWEGFSKQDDYSIYTRRLTNLGQTNGDEQIMSSRVKGIRRNTALAGAQSSYVIAWDGLGPGDKLGIFTQGTGGGMSQLPNIPPVNSVPGVQTAFDGQVLVFSAVGQNGISVSDSDAGLDSVKVSLSVTTGSLTLAALSGLSFSTGDGTADAAMTFTGR